jgi:deoxyribodipyrimidine photo-lyase
MEDKIGIFIFRRDLRIEDNPALYMLFKKNCQIIPLFILDKNQINTPYFNKKSYEYMLEFLGSLNKYSLENKLLIKKGEVIKILEELLVKIKYSYISFNLDFSKYSIERDRKIIEFCNKNNINHITYDSEMFINTSELFLKQDKSAYVVYSSYLNNVYIKKIEERKLFKTVIKFKKTNIPNDIKLKDGLNRKDALNKLHNTKEINKFYEENRRRIDKENTQLALFLKFGILSTAEVFKYMRIKNLPNLLREVHFRNFYFLIRKYNYNGYSHYDNFYKTLKWKNRYNEYKRMWIDGNTGFPIIDACVRKLNETGWLNNRSNLLLSYFSVKILHIDPFNDKIGGQLEYSKKLIYCCYASNYCNWNFILSIFDWGSQRFTPDSPKSGRFFDINNIKKIDPDLKMIRKYVKELDLVSDKDVFDWYNKYKNYKNINYKPMLNLRERINEYKTMVNNNNK